MSQFPIDDAPSTSSRLFSLFSDFSMTDGTDANLESPFSEAIFKKGIDLLADMREAVALVPLVWDSSLTKSIYQRMVLIFTLNARGNSKN